MQLSDLAASMDLRDTINHMVRDAVNKLRPRYRYATVEAIDRVTRKASVIFVGDPEAVVVNMGSIQPKEVGQRVRVEGFGTDKFIADVMGDNHLAPATADPAAPAAATFKHSQVTAAASWVITHNLNKYPAVSINIGGVQVYADVAYGNLNQVTISFPVATSGNAHLV